MKKTIHFALFSAFLGLASAYASVDCVKISQTVKLAVAADQSKILEIVSKEVAAAPSCACEVVKSAIEASSADKALVASIVETAANSAPEQLRLISQCAIAMAPDAVSEVQSVLAKLDPNRGEAGHSAKSAQGAKVPAQPVVASDWNPLDFPSEGPVGLDFPGEEPVGFNPGGPGGFPMLPPGFPVNIPPSINPPTVTDPNIPTQISSDT